MKKVRRGAGILLPLAFASALQAENVFLLGHSLVNHWMPSFFSQIAASLGTPHQYELQVGGGAPLAAHWNETGNPQRKDGSVAHIVKPELRTGAYGAFILTEAIPLRSNVSGGNTVQHATSFHGLAVAHNLAVRVYLYETWPYLDGDPAGTCEWDIDNGATWRRCLTETDPPVWNSIVTAVNAANGGPDMRMVPAGGAMALLHDEIAAGRVPGLSSIRDIFGDNIHLTNGGHYFIACVMYATVYGRSPAGAATGMHHAFSTATPADGMPPAATLRRFQEVAWQAVCNDPRSGVASCGAPPPADTTPPAQPRGLRIR